MELEKFRIMLANTRSKAENRIESVYADCEDCIAVTVVPVLSAVTEFCTENIACKSNLRQ